VCAKFNECRDSRKLTPSMELEEDCLRKKDERVGRNVNLGVEGTNSNGHGKETDKKEHMMKLIERL
jgi:hypothetical protein